MKNYFRLIQFADSAFPVGTFSFSNGLETATSLGVVHDAATLKAYARSAANQAAFTDGVAALAAFRSARRDDLAGIIKTDRDLALFRLNFEARLMQTRMGKKMAELAARLYGENSLAGRWLETIKAGESPGYFPIAQGAAFSLASLDERDLFVAHQYGVINMVLSAALRLTRVSHYDTQKILFELGEDVDAAYEEAREMKFENMNSFAPEMDIFASLHEQGQSRMVMN